MCDENFIKTFPLVCEKYCNRDEKKQKRIKKNKSIYGLYPPKKLCEVNKVPRYHLNELCKNNEDKCCDGKIVCNSSSIKCNDESVIYMDSKECAESDITSESACKPKKKCKPKSKVCDNYLFDTSDYNTSYCAGKPSKCDDSSKCKPKCDIGSLFIKH